MPVSTPGLFAHVTPVPFLTPDWAAFVDVEVSVRVARVVQLEERRCDKLAGA